jgi:hypothetical protein
MPTAEDFREQLFEVFRVAEERRLASVVVKAGDLHRKVGVYPSRNNRMPVCCEVMRSVIRRGDVIVSQPPKGKGATLTVRYLVPRPSQGGRA